MQIQAIDENLASHTVAALRHAAHFKGLDDDQLTMIAGKGVLGHYVADEIIYRQGDKSDAFSVVLNGEVSIQVSTGTDANLSSELIRVDRYSTIGTVGLLIDQVRTATAVAAKPTVLLQFDAGLFASMYKQLPLFAASVSRELAQCIYSITRLVPAAEVLDNDFEIEEDVPEQLSSRFLRAITQHAAPPTIESKDKPVVTPRRLDRLLRRMAQNAASDLHLSANQPACWRVDGEIQIIPDEPPMPPNEVFALVEPLFDKASHQRFLEHDSVDFAHDVAGLARFRVNVFRDAHGTCAVFRIIPYDIPSCETLGVPEAAVQLCSLTRGLVLVAGGTGSGKSTTLASLIDYINTHRSTHIITLEDPIEYRHTSKKALVHQREIGTHAPSFAAALHASLREDPDVVLVGEMRDLATTSLAIETANTGHLVFGTLHTQNAISAVDRMIDIFPAEQQNQVRAGLADTLRGVLCQTLCRKAGGGRIAAMELLIVNAAVSNVIREGRKHQLVSVMQTGKSAGNIMLNESLAELVREQVVDYDDALSMAMDRDDLAQRLGMRQSRNSTSIR